MVRQLPSSTLKMLSSVRSTAVAAASTGARTMVRLAPTANGRASASLIGDNKTHPINSIHRITNATINTRNHLRVFKNFPSASQVGMPACTVEELITELVILRLLY